MSYYRLLKSNARIRRLWFAQVVSELGDWLSFVALMQLITKYSGKAQASGLLVIIEMLPMIVLAPVTGVVADRFDRKKILIATDLIRFFIPFGFLFVDSPERLWVVYVLTGLQFCVTAFFEPARAALLPRLANEHEIVVANALMSVTWSTMLAVGGALGGLLVALVGSSAAFVLDASTFMLSALLLWGLAVPALQDSSRRVDSEEVTFLEALFFLRRQLRVAAVTLVKAGLCITGGSIWLLSVVYGQKVFPIGKEGAISVGLFYGANGLGSVLGASIAAICLRRALNPLKLMLAAFTLRSVFFALWAVSPTFVLAISSLVCAAATGSVLWVSSTTMLQEMVQDKMRGRIFALEFALLTLAVAVSIGATGRALDDWGVDVRQATIAAAGLAALVAAAWAMVMLFWNRLGCLENSSPLQKIVSIFLEKSK
ncbi:MAG: MFS transporter [Acidobacteriota bacterium]|nr:MFS transporter [Blastocatellia bacterium]MDW8412735.1 MFS transporter [Acidobacteriota bacterium]